MKSCTDVTMSKIFLHLAGDLNNALGTTYFDRYCKIFINHGIKGLREFKFPSRSNVSPYLFKCEYQLETLLKRYRFEKDLYTDKELLDISIEKFIDTQQRISVPFLGTSSVDMVLKEARRICKDVLGEFSPTELESHVRFGSRACFGHKYSESYLDSKLRGRLTGSTEHIEWFKKYLLSDHILADIIKTHHGTSDDIYEMCDTLALTFVPKSFKSLRSVKPQTLLGTFYTNALGSVLTDRLKRVGLDIRRLQSRHGELVKKASVTRTLATADLSAASDSITFGLLCRLLPQRWLRACMYGVARYAVVNGVRVRLSSVATMGDGHTFPLQTLVFYSLIKAIGNLLKKPDSYVSVYGDDLIYPRKLHRYVESVFRRLHFNLNAEKTYVEDFFRESCGSDYYRGCDVRPFSPEGVHRHNSRHEQAVFLYKLYNGFIRRWDPVEIPNVLSYIKTELILLFGKLHQIPPSFPDSAGIKVLTVENSPFFHPVTYSKTTMTFVFRCLRICPDRRIVESEYPYYWETLRSSCNRREIHDYSSIRDTNTLNFCKKDKVAWLPHKMRARLLGQTGSTSSWI